MENKNVIYANKIGISMSNFDVQLTFRNEFVLDDKIVPGEDLIVKISPQQLKALAKIVNGSLMNYEKAFGEINIVPKEELKEA